MDDYIKRDCAIAIVDDAEKMYEFERRNLNYSNYVQGWTDACSHIRDRIRLEKAVSEDLTLRQIPVSERLTVINNIVLAAKNMDMHTQKYEDRTSGWRFNRCPYSRPTSQYWIPIPGPAKGGETGNATALDDALTVNAVPPGCCRDCRKWHREEGWCDEHSHFIGPHGEACHPWESSDWKMFDENYFCADFAPKEDNSGNKGLSEMFVHAPA